MIQVIKSVLGLILLSVFSVSNITTNEQNLSKMYELLEIKQQRLLKTPKSNLLEYTKLYDTIAQLKITINKTLITLDKEDTKTIDETCDFILKYGEVEFFKTEYYKTPFHDEVAKTLQNIASLYEQCHPPMAEQYLKPIIKIKEHIYTKVSAEVAMAHDILGDYYRTYLANFKKAIKEYEEAKRIREKLYGVKDPRITENYAILALSLYYHGDKTSKAEKLLLGSIVIRKKAFPNISFPLYRAYMDAGFYYSLKGENAKHIDYFKKAKKTFSGEEKSDYNRILRELSISPKN